MAAEANPAALVGHDPSWAVAADRHLSAIRVRLHGLPGADRARYDHIGSTSVPGLAAKPWIDLQVRLLPLPADEDLIPRLSPLGLERAQGSRPDSPGVRHDVPRGDPTVDPEVWTKSLFVHPTERVILHVRRSDSPWAFFAVGFRDWLRSDAEARAGYEDMKRELAEREVGKADYDDYTRAKTAWFDDAQQQIERWAARVPR